MRVIANNLANVNTTGFRRDRAEFESLAYQVMTAPGADADEKRMQWTGRLGRGPSRLDQHGTRMTAADLADAAVVGGSQPGLPHPRVQTQVGDQPVR